MTVETPSVTRRQAGELSVDAREVEGPLKGYHHEAYAFPLPPENPLSARWARGKLRAPRPGVLWFDRRCFDSEDRLLIALQGRIARIPETVEVVPDVFLQGFVEGRSLGAGPLPGRTLSSRHESQLAQLFQEVVAIRTDELDRLVRTCAPGGHPAADGDSAAFLNRLIDFTAEDVHDRHVRRYGALFKALGVRRSALDALRGPAGRLTCRPYTLVHGDLHRSNFIAAEDGDLWTIDWELAMIGDPLYELATHLHLMRYTQRDADRIGALWAQAVEAARPGAARAWRQDLPHLLAYKRTQSVFTDVIRAAEALGPRDDPNWRLLPRAAWRVWRALAAAAGPLKPESVPTLAQVVSAYTNWLRAPAA